MFEIKSPRLRLGLFISLKFVKSQNHPSLYIINKRATRPGLCGGDSLYMGLEEKQIQDPSQNSGGKLLFGFPLGHILFFTNPVSVTERQGTAMWADGFGY